MKLQKIVRNTPCTTEIVIKSNFKHAQKDFSNWEMLNLHVAGIPVMLPSEKTKWRTYGRMSLQQQQKSG